MVGKNEDLINFCPHLSCLSVLLYTVLLRYLGGVLVVSVF